VFPDFSKMGEGIAELTAEFKAIRTLLEQIEHNTRHPAVSGDTQPADVDQTLMQLNFPEAKHG
jgi:hypothetical protein